LRANSPPISTDTTGLPYSNLCKMSPPDNCMCKANLWRLVSSYRLAHSVMRENTSSSHTSSHIGAAYFKQPEIHSKLIYFVQ
jgi:hypothetical protein